MPSNILESLHSQNTSNYIESFSYGHTVITVWVDPTNTRVTDLSCSWWNRLKVVGFIMQKFLQQNFRPLQRKGCFDRERHDNVCVFSLYCNNGKEVWLVRHTRPISFLTSPISWRLCVKMRWNNRKAKIPWHGDLVKNFEPPWKSEPHILLQVRRGLHRHAALTNRLLQGFLRRRNRPSFSNLAEEDWKGLVASLLVCSRKQQARLAKPPDSPCSPARPSSSLLQRLERKKKVLMWWRACRRLLLPYLNARKKNKTT